MASSASPYAFMFVVFTIRRGEPFVRARVVVFGIIIDTFGDLRGQTKDKRDDMLSTCFVCGISSDEFDSKANGFEDHIERDHNVSVRFSSVWDLSGSTACSCVKTTRALLLLACSFVRNETRWC